MKYTEIDGKSYTISACVNCMFMEAGDDGYGAHCNHPAKKEYINLEYLYYTSHDENPVRIHEDCPLRDIPSSHYDLEELAKKKFKVQKGKGILHEIKPCPFCGGEAQLGGFSIPLDRISWVECPKCGIYTRPQQLTGFDPIEVWNRRV